MGDIIFDRIFREIEPVSLLSFLESKSISDLIRLRHELQKAKDISTLEKVDLIIKEKEARALEENQLSQENMWY